MLRKATIVALTVAAVGGAGLPLVPAGAAGHSVSGIVFEDHDRNGRLDAGDVPLANVIVYAYDATTGRYRDGMTTDSSGRYSFSDLPDSSTRVLVDPAWWSSRRGEWVSTTTPGSLDPDTTVAGSGTADLGIRRIVRSTTLGSPITSYTSAEGLRTESYNDVVTARQVYDALSTGTLLGEEAANVTVRLDASPYSSTSGSAGQQNGMYTSFSAVVYVAWLAWLNGEGTLFHEYGHAWSLNYAYLAQQDASLAGYISARGLDGDSRVGSSYEWSPRELIAEDYRQLFGSASARAQGQMNTSIPPAEAVPGLREYLSGPFRTRSTEPAPQPAPEPAELSVSAPVVNPSPVKTTATVSSTLSTSARVVISVLDSRRNHVRTVVDSQMPAGEVVGSWDRKNARGQRVKAGDYFAIVTATDAQGSTTSAVTAFKVA